MCSLHKASASVDLTAQRHGSWGVFVNMKAFLLAIGFGIWLFGCGATVKQPAKDATLGALEALDAPSGNSNDKLARKLGLVLERYLDGALANGDPPGVQEITSNVTSGAVKGLVSTVPEQRWLAKHLISSSIQTAVDTFVDERGSISRVAALAGEEAALGLVRGMTTREGVDGEEMSALAAVSSDAGKRLAKAMAGEMTTWLGPDAKGPLSEAMAAAAERAAGAAVRGALAAARDEVAQCPGTPEKPCIQDVVRALSRSAAMGASEGVGGGMQPLPVIIAFAGGLAVALLAVKLMREWKSRNKPVS
jgi:hypothetical protein